MEFLHDEMRGVDALAGRICPEKRDAIPDAFIAEPDPATHVRTVLEDVQGSPPRRRDLAAHDLDAQARRPHVLQSRAGKPGWRGAVR